MIEMESERGFSREKKKDGPIWCKAGGGNLGEKMEAIFFEERERQGYPHETKKGNPPEKKEVIHSKQKEVIQVKQKTG